MAKKAPVGTVRYWASGPVIKAHDNSSLKEAWISLPKNLSALRLGREIDGLVNSVSGLKIPISGEKYIDREIKNFKADEDGEAPYHPNDVKQYSGFFGNLGYSFSSEFSRRMMAPRLALERELYERLEDFNEERKGEEGNYNYKLTAAEIKEVKKKTKEEFTYDGLEFDVDEARELKEVMRSVHDNIKKGVDFEGQEKTAYDAAKNLADRLPLDYQKLKTKKEAYKQSIEIIEKFFPDNWGITESFKDYAKDKYSEYLKKYADEIKEDNIEDQKEIFGTTIDAPTDEFYTKLRSTLNRDSELEFFDLLELRYASKLSLDLDGEWESGTLEALQIFEEIADELPPGYVSSNDKFKRLKSTEYTGRGHGTYAFYDPSDRAITLSDKLLQKSSEWNATTNTGELRSTIVHEIAHSASVKLGGQNDLSYKKFTVECGWSFQQEDIDRHATGDDQRVPRQGRNQSIPLITDYANVSPEEAFAEYFSFYHNNKKAINEYLDTGSDKGLKSDSVMSVRFDPDPKTVGQLMPKEKAIAPEKRGQMSLDLNRYVSEKNSSITVTGEDPHYTKVSSTERVNLDKNKVRNRKDRSYKSMPPVVCIAKEDGSKVVVDGVNRHLQAKLNKHLLPSINIPHEMFTVLLDKGHSKEDIVRYAYDDAAHQKVPALKEMTKAKRLHGVQYGDVFVPFSSINKSAKILKAMRVVYESDKLQKALLALGNYFH